MNRKSFREGFEDEDDSDLQEVLHNSELARKALEGIIEDVAAVCDLDGTMNRQTLTRTKPLRLLFHCVKNTLKRPASY